MVEAATSRVNSLLHRTSRTVRCPTPTSPFLCLLVSGGHTQIVRVDSPLDMQIIGTTIDDAAGRSLRQVRASWGSPPGRPGNRPAGQEWRPQGLPLRTPRVEGYDYSFSGLKTSFLSCAATPWPRTPTSSNATRPTSLRLAAVDHRRDPARQADPRLEGDRHPRHRHRRRVSANSGLRNGIVGTGRRRGWRTFLPSSFTTDNAAMIAMAGYYRYQQGEFSSLDVLPVARLEELQHAE